MKCPNCGADVPNISRCEYCGSSLELPHRSRLSRAEIFSRIRESPAYRHAGDTGRVETLLKHDLSVQLAKGGSIFSGAGLIIVVAAFFAMGPFCVLGIPLLPLVLVFWYYKNKSKLSSLIGQVHESAGASLRGEPAIVASSRSQATAAGTPQKCFVTLEYENGDRKEFEAHPTLYRRLIDDDAGMAFCQPSSNKLVEFERVRL